MEPVWNELSEKFESEKSPFQVAKVDCTQAKGEIFYNKKKLRLCDVVLILSFPQMSARRLV